ncbi:MAG: c-type cytochrome, partial [Gemmataceae bacterium]
SLLAEAKEASAPWQAALLDGLGQGMQSSQRSLSGIWDKPGPGLEQAVRQARPFFDRAAKTASDEKQSLAQRLAAVRLLGFGPAAVAEKALPELLTPANAAELQLAAVRALAAQEQPKVAELLLEGWAGYSPSLRREVVEVLFARVDRLGQLLDAVEKKQVQPGQLEATRIELLKKHPNAKIRARAGKLLAGSISPARGKIVADYQPALELQPDAARGKLLFKKNCSVCHRLENEGVEVGPDLLAALRNKSPQALLIDILDPSREVDPRYINYVVTTKAGKQYTGMISVETPTSLTLRRAEKAEDTILRNQLDEVIATSKSIMPEELEKQLGRQDVADVIAYLLSVVRQK